MSLSCWLPHWGHCWQSFSSAPGYMTAGGSCFLSTSPLLLIMLAGFQAFYEWVCRHLGKNISLALCGTLLAIGMIPIAAWMIQYHPYQNVYFNRLAGADMKTIQQRFPLDYWGLSYQRGLEEILKTDHGENINVFIESQQQALGLLPYDGRSTHSYDRYFERS